MPELEEGSEINYTVETEKGWAKIQAKVLKYIEEEYKHGGEKISLEVQPIEMVDFFAKDDDDLPDSSEMISIMGKTIIRNYDVVGIDESPEIELSSMFTGLTLAQLKSKLAEYDCSGYGIR